MTNLPPVRVSRRWRAWAADTLAERREFWERVDEPRETECYWKLFSCLDIGFGF